VALVSPPVDVERDDSASVSGEGFVASLGLPQDQLRVVMVTRLDRQMKALSVALTMSAVERLAALGVVLVVVGTGDAEAELRELADAINHRQGRRVVVLPGAMSDPRPAYAAADVVVGMGGSAARGLAFGKPLVVCGEAGWFRTFTPETASSLFRSSFWSNEAMPNPVEELAGNLTKLIANRELRRDLGRFGRAFAVERFGLPAMAERLAGIYAESIRTHRRRDWWRDFPSELGYFARRAFMYRAPADDHQTFSAHDLTTRGLAVPNLDLTASVAPAGSGDLL